MPVSRGLSPGSLTRGKTPDKALAEDAPMASRIAGSIGALAGDVPAMVGGALSVEATPITSYSRRLRASGRNAEGHHRRVRKR
jgi:hypothetical protein